MKERVKVLVVDDDRMMVKTISDILELKRFRPIAAYSGEEALEKLGGETPDCVLMDLNMPGLNGLETLTIMQERVPGVPVALVSAYITDDEVEEARRRGVAEVLRKPVDLRQVFSFLARATSGLTPGAGGGGT